MYALKLTLKIMPQAVLGEGVDRHFLGLKMIALQEKMELPELYKDPAYQRSTHYTLSSSQVSFEFGIATTEKTFRFLVSGSL